MMQHYKVQPHIKIKIIIYNLSFATTYCSNVDNKSLVTNIRKKINNSNSAYLKEVIKD